MTIPLSIYLHIPFCRTKCTYCAFNTYTKIEHLIDAFVEALTVEIRIVSNNQQRLPVHTIFFGGGTPSLLEATHIEQILTALNEQFDLSPDTEITLEANPNDVHKAYLKDLHTLGINRLSLGVQSTNDNELKLFARRHDNDEIVASVSAARAAGFTNLNLDLIYGIPHQTMDSWQWTLKQTLALQPDHLSLYALGLEEGTPMYDWVNQGRLPTPDDDLTADMYDTATDRLSAAGFEQYEISNWSKPGFTCRHNLQYWRNLPYIGLGPGAHGYAGGIRYSTILSPQQYIQRIQKANSSYAFPLTPATVESVKVNRDNEISETLIMGLRLTREGILWHTFKERFGADLRDVHGPILDRFVGYHLLEVDDDRVRLTDQGRLLSNVIFRELV